MIEQFKANESLYKRLWDINISLIDLEYEDLSPIKIENTTYDVEEVIESLRMWLDANIIRLKKENSLIAKEL